MRTYTYPAIFEPGDKSGIVVTFPDVPGAITQGKDEAEARSMASEALGLMLIETIVAKRPLPAASKASEGLIMIAADADLAVKAALLEAFVDAGITQVELGRRLGKNAKHIRRILDPNLATKMPAVAAALGALGRRLVIGVEDAV